MSSALILLKDNVRVEVEVQEMRGKPYATGDVLKRVDSKLDDLRPLLGSICKSIDETFNDIKTSVNIQSVEVELGVSFEGQGNMYITKATAGANLTVKLQLNKQGNKQG